MENADIARIFTEVADLLEIRGDNPFRVRAYRSAARTIETLGAAVESIVRQQDEKALAKLPGIGKDLAAKVREICETGELGLRQELRAELPEGLVAMTRIQGVGPKRARQVFDALPRALQLLLTVGSQRLAADLGELAPEPLDLAGLGPSHGVEPMAGDVA